jgi:hypothetical protein
MDREIEGTWEEILSHAEELAGHRVKVIVLDDDQAPASSPDAGNLYERLKDRVGQVSFAVPQDLSRRTGHYFGKVLEEKHLRRQGEQA